MTDVLDLISEGGKILEGHQKLLVFEDKRIDILVCLARPSQN